MAEGKGEGQVAIVEYRQEGDEEVPTLMLIKEGFKFYIFCNGAWVVSLVSKSSWSSIFRPTTKGRSYINERRELGSKTDWVDFNNTIECFYQRGRGSNTIIIFKFNNFLV